MRGQVASSVTGGSHQPFSISSQSEDVGYSAYDSIQDPTKLHTHRFDVGFVDASATGYCPHSLHLYRTADGVVSFPYASGQVTNTVGPTQEPPSALVTEKPVIKKEGMKFDAAQLEVLNETLTRTAFPSIEEHAELARKLNTSVRRVQIW